MSYEMQAFRQKIQVSLEILGEHFYPEKFLRFQEKVNEVYHNIPEEFREFTHLDIAVEDDYDGGHDVRITAGYTREETDAEFILRTDNLKLAEEIREENEKKLYLRLKEKYGE